MADAHNSTREGNAMPRGKGIYDDEDADDSKGQRSKSDGDDGDTATRGDAPDVADTSGEPTA
jgi:hypothetical protein